MKKEDVGRLLLRIGLGGVFFIFGLNKILDPVSAKGWVPPWLSTILPISVVTFIYILSIAEIIIGLLVLVGLYARASAAIASILLLSIILSWGLNEIMLRDAGIMFLALGITMLGPGNWSLDQKLRGKA